jgi:sulfoxide reductase heme-binding subunit YedZ
MPRAPAASASAKRLLLGSDPIRRSVYIVGLMPAVWTFYLGLTDQLGADPQNVLERTLGLWALRFLILTLAITPLRRLGGPNWIRYRRTLGLLAFYYAAMHLSVYLLLDKDLDLAAIWADIVKRPYITVGMLAFTILVPLGRDLQQHVDPAGWRGVGTPAQAGVRGDRGGGPALHHAAESVGRPSR